MGSSDLYGSARRPTASVNLVTVHDGFTLADLVSYNEKHNEANLEDNRDGTNDNRSWNLGAEGPTDDAEVLSRRARQARNMLATVLLSHGVPMLLGGDEVGRTQHGNNNAYCQDNEISWMDWTRQDLSLLHFTRRAIALRQAHRAFRRTKWAPPRGSRRTLARIAWFSPDGTEMNEGHWNDPNLRSMALLLDDTPPAPRPGARERFLLLFNAALEPVTFALPSPRWGDTWVSLLDTADEVTAAGDAPPGTWPARSLVERVPLSLVVLQAERNR
jgi:glycogen operon protein